MHVVKYFADAMSGWVGYRNHDDQRNVISSKIEVDHRFRRFKVISVKNSEVVKILKLIYLSTGEIYECQLSGSWYHSYVSGGDIVHLVSDKLLDNIYYINDAHGLITIKPDTRIKPTSLSDSTICMRKAWLNRMFIVRTSKNTNDDARLIGEIVHDIFQTACMERLYSLQHLESVKNRCLQKESVAQYCLLAGKEIENLTEKVDEFLPSIFSWLEKHFHNHLNRMYYQVEAVVDIENTMFCPSLGIEGSVDATCEVRIHSRSPRKVLMPLELKTGRAHNKVYWYGHKTQVMSYSMGMKERRPNRYASGLLLYLRNGPGEFELVMNLIQMKRPDEVELLNRRNKLAHFSSPSNVHLRGPEFVDWELNCSHCNVRFECSLMAQSFEPEKVRESSSFRQKLIRSELTHSNSRDIEFFREWMHLIKKKEWEMNREKIPFWIESSYLREQKKLGLGNLTVRKIFGNKIIFQRNSDPNRSESQNFFPRLNGRKVVISEDEPCDTVPTRAMLLTGHVISCYMASEIKVLIDQRAHTLKHSSKTYRLDFVVPEVQHFDSLDNLSYLMSRGEGSQKNHLQQLRNAIIMEPKMAYPEVEELNHRMASILSQNTGIPAKISDIMRKCVSIRRTPGFDKKIIEIVQASLESNESIIISSHSYTSLDNILRKLKNFGINFARCGPQSSISAEVKAFSVVQRMENIPESQKSIQLKKLYKDIKVAGIRFSDVKDEIFLRSRRFDVCIIDEADRIPLPMILDLLFISNFSLLIGEGGQPPKREDGKLSAENYEQSLYKTLLEKDSLITSTHQYLMNREIMSYSNRLFYRNILKCGSQEISEATVPQARNLSSHTWLDRVLSSDLDQSFLFLDTDHDGNWNSDNVQCDINHVEANICLDMVKEFTQNSGISPVEISILSPFRRQVSLIIRLAQRLKIRMRKLFIETIDKSSQEERMIVLVSFVKQGNSKDAILSDEYRLKIALTRAARKLIFIGSRSFLELHKPFIKLFSVMREEQFVTLY